MLQFFILYRNQYAKKYNLNIIFGERCSFLAYHISPKAIIYGLFHPETIHIIMSIL